ncbi:MAG: T9SS C-terminal target domain-containing protein [Methanobacteriota archaeon]|nr:MAG: T9SS C-terminal target domain-containing protein [Euryarchaeota archaeon]
MGSPTGIADNQGVGKFIPKRYALLPNYPNPFNPSTIITYDLPKATHVELTVYNLLGQRIITLVKGDKAAGRYEVRWDGRDQFGNRVASGVYLFRLKTPDYTRVRKMLVTK